MKLYIIEKDYGGCDCWGRYEENWRSTDIVYTDETKAIEYIKVHGSNYYRYQVVEAQ